MPHTVSFIRDDKDPSVLYPILINLGPLGIKEEEPDTNRLPLKDRSWARMQPRPDAILDKSLPTPGADTHPCI
tara:strand:+ start:147 stop:365 length:219 start_codon:yes stop_codon:yes gene_type:complete